MMKKGKELNNSIGTGEQEHPPLRSEVARAIYVRLQVAKPQVHADEVPAELLKAEGETVLDRMHRQNICSDVENW